MSERISTLQWRREQESTKFPFAERASLTNGTRTFLEGTFLDAAIYPVGAVGRLYLSQVVITHATAVLYVGTPSDTTLASGTFSLLEPPEEVRLGDTYGRPAGVLVSTSLLLSIFQSWGVGTHVFAVDQTEFALSACAPAPEIGLRGILLESGEVLTGDIWLVGEDGVVLREETVQIAADVCGDEPETVSVIRVDVVGDPLFRRRLCAPTALFETPQWITQLRLRDSDQILTLTPDNRGDVQLTVNNDAASDTVLRVHAAGGRLTIEAVGSVSGA